MPRSPLRLLHSGRRGNFRPHDTAQRPTQAAEGTAQTVAGFEGRSQLKGGSVAAARDSVSRRETGGTNGTVGE